MWRSWRVGIQARLGGGGGDDGVDEADVVAGLCGAGLDRGVDAGGGGGLHHDDEVEVGDHFDELPGEASSGVRGMPLGGGNPDLVSVARCLRVTGLDLMLGGVLDPGGG